MVSFGSKIFQNKKLKIEPQQLTVHLASVMYAKCDICYTSSGLRQFADSLQRHDVCLKNALQNAGNFYSFIDLPKYYHVKPNFVLHLIIQLRQKLARNTIDKNVRTAMTHRKQVQIERNSTIGHTVVTCNQKIRS